MPTSGRHRLGRTCRLGKPSVPSSQGQIRVPSQSRLVRARSGLRGHGEPMANVLMPLHQRNDMPAGGKTRGSNRAVLSERIVALGGSSERHRRRRPPEGVSPRQVGD
jgi:hypothetical protein